MDRLDPTVLFISLIFTVIIMLTIPFLVRIINKGPLEKPKARIVIILNAIVALFLFVLLSDGEPGSGAPVILWSWVAYRFILTKGSYSEVAPAFVQYAASGIDRAQRLAAKVVNEFHKDRNKRAVVLGMNAKDEAALFERYARWMGQEEATMDSEGIAEGYELLALMERRKYYFEVYEAAVKLMRVEYKKKGQWSAIEQLQFCESYEEPLPTEKDFFVQGNPEEIYEAFLQKDVGEYGVQEIKRGNLLVWYYQEKDRKKAVRVAERLLKSASVGDMPDFLKRLKNISIIKRAYYFDGINNIKVEKPGIVAENMDTVIEKWEKRISEAPSLEELKKGGYIVKFCAVNAAFVEKGARVAERLVALQTADKGAGHVGQWGTAAKPIDLQQKERGAAANQGVQGGVAGAVAGSQINSAQEERQVQFCRKCGTKLTMDSVFCKKCGTKVL